MWIDINDFKPDERSKNAGQNVLCCGSKWGNAYIAQYVNGRFKFSETSQAGADVITHWMPLPSPPNQ
jgi:hypothetical protein